MIVKKVMTVKMADANTSANEYESMSSSHISTDLQHNGNTDRL